jgi:hypothetical protein
MNTTEHRARRGFRCRQLAIVPVALVAWIALGMTSGVANAATPVAGADNGNAPQGNANATANAAGNHSNSAGNNGTDNSAGNNGNGNSNSAGNNGTDNSAGNNGNGNANGHATSPTPTDVSTDVAGNSGNATGADHSNGNAGTSGDPTKPQPPSHADQNPGGANNGGNCGAYCSTRDGSASQNGNGKGKATGKPCAGCVGKADNKNPKGQRPNGHDHNNGYECDGNHGIGKGNPAHTACTPTTPPCVDTPGHPCTPPCVDTPGHPCTPPCVNTPGHPCTPPCNPATQNCGGGGDCNTTPAGCGGETCPPGTVEKPNGDCVTPDCVPTAANHQCGHKHPECVPTKANDFCSDVEGNHHVHKPPTVLGNRFVNTPPETLPFTGTNTAGMLGTGLLALLFGLVLLALGRRQPAEGSLIQRLQFATSMATAGAPTRYVPRHAAPTTPRAWSDMTALGRQLASHSRTTVVVENRPGAWRRLTT